MRSLVLFILLMGSLQAQTTTVIVIDYPHGEERLVLESNGSARLYYGALPQHQNVKPGTFDLQQIRRQLQGKLHPNQPRELWSDPKATCGMVTFVESQKPRTDYLIFNEEQFAKKLFRRARNNIE